MTDDEWELYYAARERRRRQALGLPLRAPLVTCDKCGKFKLQDRCECVTL